MGTNYYAIDENNDKIHIGKSSAGHPFIFNTNYQTLTSTSQWKVFLHNKKIIDEYDHLYGYIKFWEMVYYTLKNNPIYTYEEAYYFTTDNEGFRFSVFNDFC